MKDRLHPTAVVTGALTLLILGVLTWFVSFPLTLLPIWVLFCGLITFSAVFGIPVVGGSVSLLPMLSVAGYLVMGPVAAGWAAFCGAILNSLVRYRWAIPLGTTQGPHKMTMLNIMLANVVMHTASILAGSTAYTWLGGSLPLLEASYTNWFPLLGLALVYLAVNYTLGGAFVVGWKRNSLPEYLHSLKQILAYEALPLIFAPLAALIYTKIGFLQLTFFAAVLIAASLAARGLDRASKRLERRVQELASLQAVGQALSASLKVETIVTAIYEQISRLMPSENFYVALYNQETDEVAFPLAVEAGAIVYWRSRRAGDGLTEYILRSRAPLLIRRNVADHVRSLGINHIGKDALCWLGVPMLAADEPLGIIAVQSYTQAAVYDLSHQELLRTIASQAAIAIQNARLYSRTDAALARRVQELDSILRTTREGILLLDLEQRVLASNRAVADLVGAAQIELHGHPLAAETLGLLGYTPETLQADCTALSAGAMDQVQKVVSPSQEKRSLSRTITPVRDSEGAIDGWLFIFRDITEELELVQLREDLTNMLVHDLRSPLTVVMGSLALIRCQDSDNFDRLRTMAQQNSERILNMVNELLDISKMESGQLPLHRAPVSVAALLSDVSARFVLLALEATIELETDSAPDLPEVYADSELLKRALSNLVDNAIKFTPDGGRVRLWARRESTVEAHAVLLGVSDTGPGIPIEAQTRIFEKFKQVAASKGRRRGTGLGLAFCKLAIEAHGGRIWVESTPGRGATFIITLPLEN